VSSRDRSRTGLGRVLAEVTTPRGDGVHPIWAAIGGVRGLIDSSVPTTAFVVANVVSGLRVGIYVAVGVCVALLLIRVVRRERLEQAFAGLFAVGVASFVASRTHSASGFFLPGILLQIPYAIAAVVSVVIGRPLIGYVAAIVNPSLSDWRSVPILRRAAAYATLVWASVFALRIAVMVPLYLADNSSALGVAKLAMGWPLWAVATGTSLLLMRNSAARRPPRADADCGSDGESDQVRPGAVADAANVRPS
jgi:hypothetical protein